MPPRPREPREAARRELPDGGWRAARRRRPRVRATDPRGRVGDRGRGAPACAPRSSATTTAALVRAGSSRVPPALCAPRSSRSPPAALPEAPYPRTPPIGRSAPPWAGPFCLAPGLGYTLRLDATAPTERR